MRFFLYHRHPLALRLYILVDLDEHLHDLVIVIPLLLQVLNQVPPKLVVLTELEHVLIEQLGLLGVITTRVRHEQGIQWLIVIVEL